MEWRQRHLDVGPLIEAWANLEDTPKLIVDHDLNVIWANHAAEEQLGSGLALKKIEEQLSCSSEEQTEGLRSFIRSCTPDLRTSCLPCDGAGHILLRAWQIGQIGHGSTIGLIFYHSDRQAQGRYTDLEEAFSLTPTQNKVLVLLLEGHTADEITTALHISIETVRSHIRSIYAKLQVTSREAMFSKLSAYRA